MNTCEEKQVVLENALVEYINSKPVWADKYKVTFVPRTTDGWQQLMVNGKNCFLMADVVEGKKRGVSEGGNGIFSYSMNLCGKSIVTYRLSKKSVAEIGEYLYDYAIRMGMGMDTTAAELSARDISTDKAKALQEKYGDYTISFYSGVSDDGKGKIEPIINMKMQKALTIAQVEAIMSIIG